MNVFQGISSEYDEHINAAQYERVRKWGIGELETYIASLEHIIADKPAQNRRDRGRAIPIIVHNYDNREAYTFRWSYPARFKEPDCHVIFDDVLYEMQREDDMYVARVRGIEYGEEYHLDAWCDEYELLLDFIFQQSIS